MKRLFSFVLVLIILIFSFVPCFAVDEKEDFVNELDPDVVYDNQYILLQKKSMSKSGTRSVNSNITVDENYLNFDNLESYNISSSSVLSSAYDYINNYVNVENAKIYLYPTLKQVDGRFGSAFLIVGSVNEMSIDDSGVVGSFASNTQYNSDYTLSYL